ncbi:MAG: hydrogenase nickel incorporation protein HypB [Verrucomicrobia bacterium]|nr:hydrogenase nickel incorporation protein HypB [Verrucomicrobiota bacterium]MBU4248461.1 hydrogenase nickel incorporation protein HypB [Verrucomicrobiota bacterium]MBU4292103.1 hydrogenase nickel incorporation protein HypB [Verrucomicrobiota bacterium]MBU4497482.1 hydrogenase nickel incorporation protein HypB [Verrucomicrobiota bacterium]MCG2681078.1 hydrogenase nickel incorporation protein HypB [Kiritimatiellia bacterium]
MSRLTIKVYRNLMGANDQWAGKTRRLLKQKNILMLNLIGSPGAGKTLLLERTVRPLSRQLRFAILEGDIATTRDAKRLAKLDCRVSQLLTGGACHLQAKMVHYAIRDLPLDDLDMVIVENVGNLVCPAEFDIGEHAKVAVLSVTEGEDKPLKYPKLFREAQAVVLTKIDLLSHVPFRLTVCLNAIRQVNSRLPVFPVSSTQGKGLNAWIRWLKTRRDSENRQ